MTELAAAPPHAVMMQMIHWQLVSRCLSLVADLGIADHLKDGPRDARELAAATDCDGDALSRVLRMLASAGVFEEVGDGRFGNSALSETLRSDLRGSMRDYARWLGTGFHWQLAGDLDYSVRTGKPSVLKRDPGTTPFEALSRDPAAQQCFNDAMSGLSAADGAAIAGSYDFARFGRILDVGGGHGTLAMAIADAAPESRVRVLDLPHVAEGTAERLRAAGYDRRVEAVGGDFFQAVPGPADLCVLKHTIHDWDDERSALVLGNCRDALADGGRVLLCEMVVSEGPGALGTRLLDIEMLIGPGGRERTEEEFARLFGAAGLELRQVIETPTATRLIEAVKAQAH